MPFSKFGFGSRSKQPRGEEAALLAAMASADAAARDAWVADHVSGEERRRFVCKQADAIGDFQAATLEELDAFTQSWSPLARARFLRGWRRLRGEAVPSLAPAAVPPSPPAAPPPAPATVPPPAPAAARQSPVVAEQTRPPPAVPPASPEEVIEPPQPPDEHVNDDDDDSGETAPKWACPACTFLNKHKFLACDVCQEPRPDGAAPPPTATPATPPPKLPAKRRQECIDEGPRSTPAAKRARIKPVDDNISVAGPRADDRGPSDDAPRRSGRTEPRSYTDWTDKGDASAAVAPEEPAAKKPARRRAAVSPGPAPKPKRPYKAQKKKRISFLYQLVQLLRDEPDVIRWTREGTIVIPDPTKLACRLPSYFKQSVHQYPSFQRQLINFGFNQQHKSASLLNTVYVRVKGEPLAGVDVSELVHLRPVLKRSPPKK